MPAVHNCSASVFCIGKDASFSHNIHSNCSCRPRDPADVSKTSVMPLWDSWCCTLHSVSFYFTFLVLKNVQRSSFCPFCTIALELYHTFSFAAQLYSIFMLLNDAALSIREWHFRAVSTIKGDLRQIKLLGFLFYLVFLLGREEEESSPRAFFCFPGLLKL